MKAIMMATRNKLQQERLQRMHTAGAVADCARTVRSLRTGLHLEKKHRTGRLPLLA